MFKRYIVACDCDDVMNNLMDVTIQKFEECTGAPFDWSRVTCFDLSQCLSKEEIDIIHSIWADLTMWESLLPQPKSQMALKAIQADGCDVYVATATDLRNAYIKQQWIAKYYPFIPNDNFIVIQDKSLLQCDFIIDDRLETLKQCSPAIHRICVDKPWNRQKNWQDDARSIHRVADLVEAHEVIKQIMEEENRY